MEFNMLNVDAKGIHFQLCVCDLFIPLFFFFKGSFHFLQPPTNPEDFGAVLIEAKAAWKFLRASCLITYFLPIASFFFFYIKARRALVEVRRSHLHISDQHRFQNTIVGFVLRRSLADELREIVRMDLRFLWHRRLFSLKILKSAKHLLQLFHIKCLILEVMRKLSYFIYCVQLYFISHMYVYV